MGRKQKFFEPTEVQIVPVSILPQIKAICENWGRLDEKQKNKMINILQNIIEK
jgi:hypothetical protein